MITSRRHTAALTRALEVKAEQATTADSVAASPSFDPTRRRSTVSEATELTDLFDDVPSRPPRLVVEEQSPQRRRRPLLPAVALIVVLALAGAGVVSSLGGSNDGDVRTVTLGEPPDGWLVPTWAPEGMDVWGVESSSGSGPSFDSDPDTIPQLFGDPDAGRAFYITSSRYEVRPDTAEQVSVRGQTGQAGRSWDVEESDVGDAIRWQERGVAITALYQGMTRNEAVAALDSLEWRSDDAADGFAPPSDVSWPLVAEVSSQQRGSRRDVSLFYSEGVPALDTPEGLTLLVHTSSSSAISIDYLDEWYLQGSEAGGGEEPLSRYDPDRYQLRVFWPDGRSTYIVQVGHSPPSQPPSRAMLERIADSMTVATEADLAVLRDTVGGAVEALPVLASAATGIGTVEVHGEGGFLRLCLLGPSEGGASCMTDTNGGRSSADGTAMVSGEWTVDGTWYVVVASTGDVPRIVGGRDRSSAPDAGELPAETTTADDWTIRLFRPAPDIDQVCMTSEGSIGCMHHRSD